jgi:hypothetical protein
LEKEYEIFNDPNLPSTRALTRFDCWEEDKTGEQWLEECKHMESESHALSPCYEYNMYVWRQVRVLNYDPKRKKFKVLVLHTSQEKWVTRLSLQFHTENKQLFEERVRLCKERQGIVEAELRFTSYVDSLSKDNVSEYKKEYRTKIVDLCLKDNHSFFPDNYVNKCRYLLKIAEEEYVRQMKKCLILKDMEDINNMDKYEKLRIPLRLPQKTTKYLAVLFTVAQREQIKERVARFEAKNAWMQEIELIMVKRVFADKCEDFQKYRFMQTSKGDMGLPLTLKKLKQMEQTFLQQTNKSIENHWREYLHHEMQDRLQKNHKFFNVNKIHKI